LHRLLRVNIYPDYNGITILDTDRNTVVYLAANFIATSNSMTQTERRSRASYSGGS
jgi:hypothetical protein